MKQTLFILSMLISSLSASAQIDVPRPSPLSTISQKVAITDVSITYYRPSAKGRKIFGDLVPYDKMWRTAANMATVLKLGDEAIIAGQKIPAGEYALFSIPSATEWTIILNSRAKQSGLSEYKEAEDVLRFKVKPETTGFFTETFTFQFANITDGSATLEMLWENTRIAFPIRFEFDAKVMKQIADRMSGPSASEYYTAAIYYKENGKDMKQALEWINKALAINERYWMLTQKATIQAELKDFKGAIETATKARNMAMENGNEDYVKINNDNIAKWQSGRK